MISKNVVVEVHGLPILLSDNIKAIGVHGPVVMNENDIFKCIAGGAYVWEVKQNGDKVKLDFTNYNKMDASPENLPIQPKVTPAKPEGVSQQQQYNNQKYNNKKNNKK